MSDEAPPAVIVYNSDEHDFELKSVLTGQTVAAGMATGFIARQEARRLGFRVVDPPITPDQVKVPPPEPPKT